MKDQDRFDWEDSEDFADLNGNLGASPAEDDFPVDSLSDFDSISSFDDLDPLETAPAEMAGAAEPEPGEETPPAGQDEESSGSDGQADDSADRSSFEMSRESRGVPAWIVSFVFFILPLVAAGGLGYTLLLALGGQPADLWNPSGFTQLDSIFDFQQNPLHLLYLAGLGVVVLALLAGKSAAHLVGKDRKRLGKMEDLLDRLTGLRLDDEKAWQNPRFKSDAAVSSFVSEILGAWRFQQSRQRKYIGLEGELLRLERALTENTKDALSERFDNPIAGKLADEMIRIFDKLEAAKEETKSVQEKDGHQSHTIVGMIQDARSWNRHTFDQVGVQGVCLEKVSSRLKDLKRQIESMSKDKTKTPGAGKDLKKLAVELDKVIAPMQGSSMKGTAAALSDLVDRCSKLAFQIAMEVARLGPRGERLLPMTQNLEALTTEFRKLAEQLSDSQPASGGLPTPLKKIQQKLKALADTLGEAKPENLEKIGALAAEIVPDAHSAALNLADIAVSFNTQGERLTTMGEAFSELTGAHFDSETIRSSDPDSATKMDLQVTGNDPFFASTAAEPAVPEVDPFKPEKPSILGEPAEDSGEGLDITVTPGRDIDLGSDDDGPVLDADEMIVDPVSPGEDLLSGPGVDLSSGQDVVYNMDELGGEPLADGREELPQEDHVHDISEFGAQPLAPAEDKVAVPEPVFDLNDMGAQKLEEPAAQDVAGEEEIYDLMEFGARRLEDSAVEEDEEKVYDLSELGAVALN